MQKPEKNMLYVSLEMTKEDIDILLGIVTQAIRNVTSKRNMILMRQRLDPGYENQKGVDAFNEKISEFENIRDTLVGSQAEVMTIADMVFAKSHMFDVLTKMYFDFEIESAYSKNLVVADSRPDVAIIDRTRVIVFTDKSCLLVEDRGIRYKDQMYEFSNVNN